LKESYTATLARIDEKLKNVVEKVDTLIEHVNHQNELICGRLTALEDINKVEAGKKKGEVLVYRCVVAALGILSTVLIILGYLGLV